jgi:hypothetical protein
MGRLETPSAVIVQDVVQLLAEQARPALESRAVTFCSYLKACWDDIGSKVPSYSEWPPKDVLENLLK